MRSSRHVLLAWLVTGSLVEAGNLFGLAVNFELLVSCALISVAHLWFRQLATGAAFKTVVKRPSRPLQGALLAVPATSILLLLAPRAVVRVLAAGPDNGAWLLVSSQFADQRPVWPGYGGPMTVALALATGVGRLFAVSVRASPSSVVVPIAAVSFITVLSLVVALRLSRRSSLGWASDLALRVGLLCGAVLFLDFGHLTAWLVLLLLTTCLVGYRSAGPEEQIVLLWVAALSLLLWIPVKPLAVFGCLGVLVLLARTRRTRGLSRGLLVIDATVIIVPLLISVWGLVVMVNTTGGFAISLPSISVGELFRGAAEYLSRPGGTHSFPLILSFLVFGVLVLLGFRSRPGVPVLIGLAMAVWALAVRVVDEVMNGGGAYGSQKVLLLASFVALVSISVSHERSPKLSFFATAAVMIAAVLSFVDFHSTPDASTANWRGESWEGVVNDGLRTELSALPIACLTDLERDRFDNPIVDDLSVRSAYTCTRFLGSLAGRDDLPNDLLKFNAGRESWGWVMSRVSDSSFRQNEILVLDSSRVPYRRTRLIDFASESGSLRELKVLTMSRVPDAMAEGAPPHSIDDVDVEYGVVSGWASSSISALVLVSEQLGDATLATVRRSPRSDVELLLGPRELASGFNVEVVLPEAEAVCFLVIDVDGRVFRALPPFGC